MSYLSIDVGGTFIKYAAMESDGTILHQGRIPTPYTTPENYLDTLVSLADGPYEGICLAAPGFIDTENGVCVSGGSLEYLPAGFPIVSLLEERLHIPVTIENDARCAAMAELWQGSLAGCRNALAAVIGTGIGMVVIINGEIYRGSHNIAGEIGYTLLENTYTDIHDLFGMRLSTAGMLKKIRDASGQDMNGEEAMERYREKDAVLYPVIDRHIRDTARALFALQCIFDAEKIAVGGGISRSEVFLNALREKYEGLYEEIPYSLKRAEITPCAFHNDSNLIGALYRHLYMNKTSGGQQ